MGTTSSRDDTPLPSRLAVHDQRQALPPTPPSPTLADMQGVKVCSTEQKMTINEKPMLCTSFPVINSGSIVFTCRKP